MTTELTFRICEMVGMMTQEYQEYVPAAGSKITITEFLAEAAYDRDMQVCLVWDFGGASQEILWCIKGSGRFDNKIEIDASKVDGTKKLALVLDNSTLDMISMAATMTVLVEAPNE